MQIRDRIKELRRVRAGDLLPNPRNWRMHPEAQQNALRGILAEVGFADALLVRELTSGELEIVDGHLRAETTPDALVSALVLDVNAEEADKILLTHDTITTLADTDEDQFRSLLDTCEFASTEVSEMLNRVEQDLAKQDDQITQLSEKSEPLIPELFQVVAECESEAAQQELYDRLKQEGYSCRVLTL